MPKSISWTKLVRRLREFSFTGPFSGGRHLFMVKGTLKLGVGNPHDGDISSDLLSKILRQAGVTTKEWIKKK